MLERLHSRKKLQLILALFTGIVFGFLLQKGGVARHEVIVGQLLLKDNTVLKVMLSAVIVGMTGVYVLMSAGLARLHPKTGSLGSIIPGGILFGVGFALLGYCPGTLLAAAGQGNLDAVFAGIPGMLAGAWLYAVLYPRLNRQILGWGNFGSRSVSDHLKLPPSVVVPAVAVILLGILFLIERAGG